MLWLEPFRMGRDPGAVSITALVREVGCFSTSIKWSQVGPFSEQEAPNRQAKALHFTITIIERLRQCPNVKLSKNRCDGQNIPHFHWRERTDMVWFVGG